MPPRHSTGPISSASSSRSAEIEPGAKSHSAEPRRRPPCSEKGEQGGALAPLRPLFGGRYQGEKSNRHTKSVDSSPLRYFGSDTYEPDRAPRSREVFAGCRGPNEANRGTTGGERTPSPGSNGARRGTSQKCRQLIAACDATLELDRPADTHDKCGPAGAFDTLSPPGRHQPNRLLNDGYSAASTATGCCWPPTLRAG
jgi:hypothetical protein